MELYDFVHGNIIVPDVIAKIIKTPHFQRLKNIKQLGVMYKVLPSANYTRYEHSIGTYYLAAKMLDSLENNGNWLFELSKQKIQYDRYKIYREAVKIAALLHDIGHGPFSHAWEKIVPTYNHEEVGKNCIDDIFNSLEQDCLSEFRADKNYGIEIIKALILGDYKILDPPFPKQFRFLFEIVHNNQCELDIDKLDYLKRDTFFAQKIFNDFKAVNKEFDCIFFEARVGEKGRHIEYRYDHFKKIYELFETRSKLHVKFYRMPKVNACEWLLTNIITSEKYEIDGIPINKIHSHPVRTFLAFYDEKILQVTAQHCLFPYLNDPANRIEITDNEQDNNIIELNYCLNAPGTVMPADDMFHFYGDTQNKETIVRDTKPIKMSFRFRLVN